MCSGHASTTTGNSMALRRLESESRGAVHVCQNEGSRSWPQRGRQKQPGKSSVQPWGVQEAGQERLRRRQRKREQWKSSVLHVISNYWVRERCSNCSNPPSLPLSLPRTAVATAPWSPPRRARRAPCLCSPGQTDCAVKESSKVSSR